jgi:hypothetical protein
MPISSTERKIALVAGVFFVITFVVSIPALVLYEPLLKHSNYVLGAGADTRITFGALCEVFLVIANIGTAVTLYPVLRRQNEGVAIGYVASRVLESTIIAIGIISVLSVVTLRQDVAGTAGAHASQLVAGKALVAIHDWTFLLGPAFCAGFGTGTLLGYLMYKSGLVPRGMALLGVIGGPLAFATAIAVMFGAFDQSSGASFLGTAGEIAWEASLGIYLIVKGFKPSAITGTRHTVTDGVALRPALVAP